MKVILLQDVNKVGKKNDIVEVADGYGQNYLIRRNLAVLATKKSKKEVEKEKQKERQKAQQEQDEALELKDRIEGLTLEFKMATGKDGKPFGSVSTKNIVDELNNKYDIKIDKRKFIDAKPIQTLGYTKVKVEIYKGVIATIYVHVSEK